MTDLAGYVKFIFKKNLDFYNVKSHTFVKLADLATISKKNLFSIYNPGQNIWNKIEKSSKIGQVKRSLTSIFACFWTTIAKV